MFKVIVLGGVALVGAQACGSESSTTTSDAGVNDSAADTFPGELPAFIDSGTDTSADTASDAGPETFPGELPTQIDTGTDTSDAPDDGFPPEL